MSRYLSLPVIADYISEKQLLSFAKLAFILGITLMAIYAVGFSDHPALHTAFHDVRHAAALPCH